MPLQNMMNKVKIVMAVALALMAQVTMAQDITGRVLDATGNALPGASIYWAETNVGTATEPDGTFRLHRVKGHELLVASFLGYTNDTLRIEGRAHDLEIRLQQGVVLEEVVVEATLGNYIRQDGLLKSENISFAGLCKMACCNLAESFENSASVTVGYSDAITGARQIKMLGLAGTYTQVLDENRAIMRGLSAPYGLSYTPGMWLSSIQVSKGISSVTAGHEAVTGQINLEHRKPTDEERLFLNLYLDDELKPEINLSTALPVTKDKRLSTVILAHGSTNTHSWKMCDSDKDGFRDMPFSQQINIANRWLYQAKNGMQVRWGAKYVNDYRLGGRLDYEKSTHRFGEAEGIDWRQTWRNEGIYGSEVKNQEVNAYFKLGTPIGPSVFDKEEGDEVRSNIAFVIDYDYFRQSSYFGADKDYFGRQHMVNANLMYVHYFTHRSSLNVGTTASMRLVGEELLDFTGLTTADTTLARLNLDRAENEAGVYAEYTYSIKDKLSVVAGMRYDYNFYFRKNLITPRAHLKWNITPTTVFRASAGVGYRPTDIITDNIGVLATGRRLVIEGIEGGYRNLDRMEMALTAGGSLSQSISTFAPNDMTISVDYFRTELFHSIVVDQERDASHIYVYESGKWRDGWRSFTDTYQLDLTWTPVERLDIFATFRYTNSKYTIARADGTLAKVDRPLTGAFKTLLNIQYATRMRKWVFDVTAQLNGSSWVPTQTGDLTQRSKSPIYPIFFAQISRRIKAWEIYLGCENIAGFTQAKWAAKHNRPDMAPIINAADPYASAFNSACVWGPLKGRKFYVGVRFNLY